METMRATAARPQVKTPFRREKERREDEMLREHRRLMTQHPERSLGLLREYLSGKYGIFSLQGYYSALRRAEERTGESRWPEGMEDQYGKRK